MNISFVASEKFLTGAKVMLVSFLKNNDFEEHDIFWLYTDVPQNVIDDFCEYFRSGFGQEITPFRLTKDMLDRFFVDASFGVASFHKLFVYNYLPIKGDRILSLDSDALITGSLKDFYYQDMEGFSIASSRDLYVSFIESEYISGSLGFGENDTYINLGNTLFYLKNYLNDFSVDDFAAYVNKNPDKVKFVAQDVLNVMLKGKIKVCDAYKYNLQIYNNIIFNKELSILNEIKTAMKNDPVIVHYVRPTKPWDFRYFGGGEKFFYKYFKIILSKKEYFRFTISHIIYVIYFIIKKITKRILRWK